MVSERWMGMPHAVRLDNGGMLCHTICRYVRACARPKRRRTDKEEHNLAKCFTKVGLGCTSVHECTVDSTD